MGFKLNAQNNNPVRKSGKCFRESEIFMSNEII